MRQQVSIFSSKAQSFGERILNLEQHTHHSDHAREMELHDHEHHAEHDHDHKHHAEHDHEHHAEHDHDHKHHASEFETFEFFNDNGGRFTWSQPNGAGSDVNITYAIADNFQLNGLSESESNELIEEALSVWAEVAPLNFKEITDPGNDQDVDIRVKSEFIDGNSNTLGFAFFPQGGDITFDSGENSWSSSLFLETAVHEVGHSLGLGHDNSRDAIMNSRIQGRYDGPGTAFLLPDDINGIRSLYGRGSGSVETLGEAPPSNPPNDNPPTDENEIRGNNNDNRLFGTGKNDKIFGLAGNDTLGGKQGNDELFGGDGGDRLIGSKGNDKLFGDRGRDRLIGGNGSDTLVGGADNDTLIGARFNDQMPGTGERDRLKGGGGGDLFILGSKKTVFYDDNNASDYALVRDFNPEQGDMLQLKGRASDYSLGAQFNNVPNGLTLSRGQGENSELIAVIQGTTNLSLNSDSIRYV